MSVCHSSRKVELLSRSTQVVELSILPVDPCAGYCHGLVQSTFCSGMSIGVAKLYGSHRTSASKLCFLAHRVLGYQKLQRSWKRSIQQEQLLVHSHFCWLLRRPYLSNTGWGKVLCNRSLPVPLLHYLFASATYFSVDVWLYLWVCLKLFDQFYPNF